MHPYGKLTTEAGDTTHRLSNPVCLAFESLICVGWPLNYIIWEIKIHMSSPIVHLFFSKSQASHINHLAGNTAFPYPSFLLPSYYVLLAALVIESIVFTCVLMTNLHKGSKVADIFIYLSLSFHTNLSLKTFFFFVHQLIVGIFPWGYMCSTVAKEFGDIEHRTTVYNYETTASSFLLYLVRSCSDCTITIMQQIAALCV